MKKLIFLALTVSSLAFAQVGSNVQMYATPGYKLGPGSVWDASGAPRTLPNRLALSDPACTTPGETYFNTVALVLKTCTVAGPLGSAVWSGVGASVPPVAGLAFSTGTAWGASISPSSFDAAGSAAAAKATDIADGVMANMFIAAYGDSTIANNGGLEVNLQGRSNPGQELAGMPFYNPTSVTTDAVGWATLTFPLNPFTTVGQRFTCSNIGVGNNMADTYTVSSFTPTTVTFGTASRINSVALATAGTGYAVNDTLTLAGGASTHQAILVVKSVGAGGALVSWSILDPGNYNVTTQTTFTQGSTSAAGTGASFQSASYGAAFGGPVLNYSASVTGTCSGAVVKYGNNGVTVAGALTGSANWLLSQTIADLQTAKAAGKYPAIYLRMGINDVRTDATNLPTLVGLYQQFVSQVTTAIPGVPIMFLAQNSMLGINITSLAQSVTPITTTASSGAISAGTNTITLTSIPPSIWPGAPSGLAIAGPSGIPFQITLDPAGLSSITASGGTGYAVNDLISLNACGGPTGGTPPVLKVTSVSSGAITGVTITTAGQCGVEPSSSGQLSTNGAGTGASFTGATYTNAVAELATITGMVLNGSTLTMTFTNANAHAANFVVQATEATAAQNFSRELRDANAMMATLGYSNVRVVQTQDLEYGTVSLSSTAQTALMTDQLHPGTGVNYEAQNILAPALSSIATVYQSIAGVTGARTINPIQTLPVQNNGSTGSEGLVSSPSADPAFCAICASNARMQAGMGSGQLAIYPNAPMDDNYWTTITMGDFGGSTIGNPGYVRLNTTFITNQAIGSVGMAVCFSGNGGCMIPPNGSIGFLTQNNVIQQINISNNAAFTLNQISVSGGTGYVVNDIITLSGGTAGGANGNAQIRVTAVSGGAITGYYLFYIGWYSATGTTITQGSTSGVGTGAVFSNPVWANIPYGLSGQRVYLRQPKMVDLASRAFLSASAQYPNHRRGNVTGLNGSFVVSFNDNTSLIAWMSSIASGQGSDYIVVQGIGKVQLPTCNSILVNSGNGSWTCNVTGQNYLNWGNGTPIDIFSTRPPDIASSSAIMTSLNINNGVGPTTAIAPKTSTYLATVNDFYIGCNATAGPVTIQLPGATGNVVGTGRLYFITKTDSSANACTVQAAINGGATSVTLPGLNANYWFYWTGAAWAYTQAGSAVLGASSPVNDCVKVGSDGVTLVDAGSPCATVASTTYSPAVLSGGPGAGLLQGNDGPSGATSLVLWDGQAWNRLDGCGDETTTCIVDDFPAGGLTTNLLGTNGWQLRNIVSAPVLTVLNGVLPHIGQLRLTSPATAGNGGDLSMTVNLTLPYGNLIATMAQPWSQTWIFQIGTNTNTSFRIGITGNNASAIEPAYFVGVRFDTQAGCADANLYFTINNNGSVCAATGVTYSSSTGSGLPASATWYKLVMSNIVSGVAAANQVFMALYTESTGTTAPTLVSSASFCASGCTVTTAASLLTGQSEGPVAIIASAPGGSGAAANLTVDYFNFKAATPSR